MNFTMLDNTINLLKRVISDENCKKMNLSNVKGYLGELLVVKKLAENTHNIVQKGNQSGYDIELPDENIKIDVKYSTIKAEIKNCPLYWGWALKFKSKKRPITCSHFVCVAANQDYDVAAYYVIKSENLNLFPKAFLKQFQNVERGLCLIYKPSNYSKVTDESLKNYFQNCSKLLDEKLLVKVSPKGNLLKTLRN